MSVLALGTSNDWTGRTADFAGVGAVLTTLAVAVAVWMVVRRRVTIGGATVATAAAVLGTVAVLRVFELRPSPWWVLLVGGYAAVATWDLQRTMRRGSAPP